MSRSMFEAAAPGDQAVTGPWPEGARATATPGGTPLRMVLPSTIRTLAASICPMAPKIGLLSQNGGMRTHTHTITQRNRRTTCGTRRRPRGQRAHHKSWVVLRWHAVVPRGAGEVPTRAEARGVQQGLAFTLEVFHDLSGLMGMPYAPSKAETARSRPLKD